MNNYLKLLTASQRIYFPLIASITGVGESEK